MLMLVALGFRSVFVGQFEYKIANRKTQKRAMMIKKMHQVHAFYYVLLDSLLSSCSMCVPRFDQEKTGMCTASASFFLQTKRAF